jgi:hypothetical protein
MHGIVYGSRSLAALNGPASTGGKFKFTDDDVGRPATSQLGANRWRMIALRFDTSLSKLRFDTSACPDYPVQLRSTGVLLAMSIALCEVITPIERASMNREAAWKSR